MASQEVKVVGFWVSPFVNRVIWALKLKGIDFEYIEEDIFNKTPLLLTLNPVNKKVPVLLHNNKPIVESFIIMEYIDETWNQNPLLPQDPAQRASVRFWAKFTEEKISEATINALFSSGEGKEKAVKMVIDGLEHLEAQLKGKKFFGGESIGYLDLVAGWISYALPVFEEVGSMFILDPLKFPSIIKWMKDFTNYPVIIDNIPPRDKSVTYFHERRQILEAAGNALFSPGEEKEKAVKMVIDGLEHLEAQLKEKKFFGGESIGYLDLVAGWISYALLVHEEVRSMPILDPLKFPSIIKWMKDFTNHPVIIDNIPPRDKYVTFFHKRREELLSTPHGWIRI